MEDYTFATVSQKAPSPSCWVKAQLCEFLSQGGTRQWRYCDQVTYTALLKGLALPPPRLPVPVPRAWHEHQQPPPYTSSWGCCRSCLGRSALRPMGCCCSACGAEVFQAPPPMSAAANSVLARLSVHASRRPSGRAAGPQLCRAECLVHTPLGCPVGVLNTSRLKSRSVGLCTGLSLPR